MVFLLQKVVEFYHYVNYDLSDPRTRQYYIITNPILMMLLMVIYYKLTTKWGPKFMEKREPFKLHKILIVYNVFQILVSAYITFELIRIVFWNSTYSIICQPLTREQTPIEMSIITFYGYYYYQKLTDLLETIFFVLRKKFKQVSSLHLYHHIVMIYACFIGIKYVAGGHGVYLGIINCFVHTIMYSYYLVTVIFPGRNKFIWWKKYITMLQLVQFTVLFIHFSYVFLNPYCTYPKWICLKFNSQNSIMIYLFGNFYYKEYILKNKQKKIH